MEQGSCSHCWVALAQRRTGLHVVRTAHQPHAWLNANTHSRRNRTCSSCCCCTSSRCAGSASSASCAWAWRCSKKRQSQHSGSDVSKTCKCACSWCKGGMQPCTQPNLAAKQPCLLRLPRRTKCNHVEAHPSLPTGRPTGRPTGQPTGQLTTQLTPASKGRLSTPACLLQLLQSTGVPLPRPRLQPAVHAACQEGEGEGEASHIVWERARPTSLLGAHHARSLVRGAHCYCKSVAQQPRPQLKRMPCSTPAHAPTSSCHA